MYYFYMPDDDRRTMTDDDHRIFVTADRLLRSIGASRRLTGFDYAEYMINRIVNDKGSVRLITKRLYPETAKFFGVKSHSVEHALRTLINYCWEYGDQRALTEIAGRAIARVPSNAEFIDMMATYLIHINNK